MLYKMEYQLEEQDLEPRYHHLHHAQALAFLELCRVRYMDQIGWPLESLLEQDKFLVITNISASYKRELKAGGISLIVDNAKCEKRTLKVVQAILNSKGKEAVRAELEFMFMSQASKRAIDPPEDFVKAFTGE